MLTKLIQGLEEGALGWASENHSWGSQKDMSLSQGSEESGGRPWEH